MRDLSLFITQVCNENCYYCDIPTIKNPKHINLSLYKTFCDVISNYKFDFLSLSGGEPGVLDTETLDRIFSLSPFKLKVNTNGLFIEKKYHLRYRESIHHICHHIIRLEDDIEWASENDLDYRVYVVTESNIKTIGTVREKYKNIFFKIYDDKLNDLKFLPTEQQLEKYKEHIIEKGYFGKPLESCLLATRQIDLVNGRILKCCKSYTNSPSLRFNEANLRELLKDNRCEEWSCCKSCSKRWSKY